MSERPQFPTLIITDGGLLISDDGTVIARGCPSGNWRVIASSADLSGLADGTMVVVPREADQQRQDEMLAELVHQYEQNRSWDEAKDVLEGVDLARVYRAALAARPATQKETQNG